MNKFEEPEAIDPRELAAGDQVGCIETGRSLQLLTGGGGGQDIDEVWMTLCNNPGETTHVWDEPVAHGNVALYLGPKHGWKVNVLPRVWARRAA